jgi:hypothetical protein
MKDEIIGGAVKVAMHFTPIEILLTIAFGFAVIMIIVSFLRGDNNYDL